MSTAQVARWCETLERRALLSATGGTVVRADHVIVVTGTPAGDNVGFGAFFTDVFTIDIVLNGKEYKFDDPEALVDRAVINTLGGDDYVGMSQANADVTINLGAGNDSAFVNASGAIVNGGAGDDMLDELDSVCFFDGGSGTDYFQRERGEVNTLDISNMPGVENATNAYGDLIGNNLNNHLQIQSPGYSVIGGGGNDTLEGPTGATLLGGPGNDKLVITIDDGTEQGDLLRGDAGNDTLVGSERNDTLDGGTGADVMKGGAGFDTLDYSTRTHNLVVGIGTRADDGELNEHDNVFNDVEKVIGGSGNDLLRGNASANVLLGLAGNDTLDGGGGNDNLFGGSGNDQLIAGPGNDFMQGQSGNDTFFARDHQRDTVRGGPGNDRAQVDKTSIVEDRWSEVETLLP
jgi:Ca2+-binding RTX toxin-like protein